MKERVVVGWSGGKDSALALREIVASDAFEVVALVTTVTSGYDRISMHGVRCALLDEQAAAIGVPLRKVTIPPGASNAQYEAAMHEALREFKWAGVTRVVFGDLFLTEIRAYRDRMLAEIGMTAIYPVWGRDTTELARDFIAYGFEAVLVCVDPKQIDPAFAGRTFDASLLRDLPPTADPCGENGEFHTFVYNGPIFRRAVPVQKGDAVTRSGFRFCDFLPASDPQSIVV